MDKTGQCLCSKLRYTVSGDPMVTALCHCTQCQRASGSAFSLNMVLREDQITMEGTPKTYHSTGDSGGQVTWYFCDACGTTLMTTPGAQPGIAVVKAGTLDDCSGLEPALEIYCDSKQDWLSLEGEMISLPKAPPAPGA